MNKFKYLAAFAFCLISTMVTLPPAQAQIMAGPAPSPVYESIDLSSIKEQLALETREAKQAIIDRISSEVLVQSGMDLVQELAKGLTVEELKKLYHILLEAYDVDWTEELAELVWQARSIKIKLESQVLYGNPRIELIAVFPDEQHFSMMLSDGSSWEVADHLSGDPKVDLIIIRDLLGQYAEVEPLSGDGQYGYRISALGFPDIRFNGYMMANKADRVNLDGKILYWLGELYSHLTLD